MSIFRKIKNWMVKRKKKKRSLKEKTVENLIVGSILLLLVATVLSFTTYGADAYQYLVDHNTDASWAPWLQWRAASLYQVWGSNKAAAAAFKKYHTNYQEKVSIAKIIEAEYWEISVHRDGMQYGTAFQMLGGDGSTEGFLSRYEAYEANEYYQKAKSMYDALNTMEQSKRYDNPLGW